MEELRALNDTWPFEKVMGPNIREGRLFAECLRQAWGPYVLSPMPLKVKGWTQGQYMALWERVLIEHIHIIHFSRGWQYSNGCVEEFLVGLMHGLEFRTHEGKVLTCAQGASYIARAIENLERWGMDASKLLDLYRRILLAAPGPGAAT